MIQREPSNSWKPVDWLNKKRPTNLFLWLFMLKRQICWHSLVRPKEGQSLIDLGIVYKKKIIEIPICLRTTNLIFSVFLGRTYLSLCKAFLKHLKIKILQIYRNKFIRSIFFNIFTFNITTPANPTLVPNLSYQNISVPIALHWFSISPKPFIS